jgi:hypothetical protein
VEWQGHSRRVARVDRRRYVVEAIDDEAPLLSPEEEAGIDAALESYARAASSIPGTRA